MRRVIQLIGWLMIIAGLGFVTWFAWQYWGTNIVSEQKQQEILDDWENTDAVGILRAPRFGADYEAYCRRVPRWIPRARQHPSS